MRPNVAILSVLGALALASAGCSADSSVGSDESDMTMSSSRTRTLSAPIAVPHDSDIGGEIQAVLTRLAGGAQPYDQSDTPWGDTVCHVAYYQAEGFRYLNWEDCEGQSRILRGYQSGNMPDVVWADHNYDGKIDGWSDDDIDGFRRELDDDNHDGRVDRESIDVELLGPDWKLEGYDGCDPPQYLAMRILEDTNFDGQFDQESVTAGRSPEGDWSYWLCP